MLLDPILAAIHRLSLDNRQRRAAASLLRIQTCGERIAMEGARAQAAIAPTREAQQFLLCQSRQEAFHARLFGRVAQALADSVRGDEAHQPNDDIPAPLLRVRDSLRDAISRQAYTDAVVIQHVALEGLGIAVLERLDNELPSIGRHFDYFRRLVLAQEAAHFTFGAQILDSHVPDRRLARLARHMLDEAECLLHSIAPQFRVLGGDVRDMIVPLHTGMLASTGAD